MWNVTSNKIYLTASSTFRNVYLLVAVDLVFGCASVSADDSWNDDGDGDNGSDSTSATALLAFFSRANISSLTRLAA